MKERDSYQIVSNVASPRIKGKCISAMKRNIDRSAVSALLCLLACLDGLNLRAKERPPKAFVLILLILEILCQGRQGAKKGKNRKKCEKLRIYKKWIKIRDNCS